MKNILFHHKHLLLLIGLCLLAIVVLVGSFGRRPERPLPPGAVFYDFEDEAQLDHINWQCGTVFRRVRKHAADGLWSLEIEMHPEPGNWPGFGTGFKNGIEPGGCLELMISNPQAHVLKLSYRIDDRPNPPYGDRLNGRINLAPGSNSVVFDFNRLKTPHTHRHLRPERLYRFFLFLHHPEKTTTIYIDRLAVGRGPRPQAATATSNHTDNRNPHFH